MKNFYMLLMITVLFSACKDSENLQNQIDNLKNKSKNNYVPGFGEFMSAIQVHHAKLWFAGINKNWKLAQFELDEIKEIIDAIQKYKKERIESRELPVINPALDRTRIAIKQGNKKLFINSFTTLTKICNQCHQSTNFGFNVIKIPDSPPLTNQDFSGGEK